MRQVKIAVLPITFVATGSMPKLSKLPSLSEIDKFFNTNNPMGLLNYINKNTFGAYEILSYTIFKPLKLDATNSYDEGAAPGSEVHMLRVIDEFSKLLQINWSQYTDIIIISNHINSSVAAGFHQFTLVPSKTWFPFWYLFKPPNSPFTYYMSAAVCPTDRKNIPLPINIRQHEMLHMLGFNHVYNSKKEQIGNHNLCAMGHGYALSAGNLYTTTKFYNGNPNFVTRMLRLNRFREINTPIIDQAIRIKLLALDVAHHQLQNKPASYYTPFLVIVRPNKPNGKTYLIEFRKGKNDVESYDKYLPFYYNLVIHSYDPTAVLYQNYTFEVALDLPFNNLGGLAQKVSISLKDWGFGIIVPTGGNDESFLNIEICGMKYFKDNR
jgi:hypothetical protein